MNQYLSLIALLFLTSYGYAQRQVYVSLATGSDTGDGSQDRPYRQIQQAADNAQPGDVINIAAGVYYENVVVNRSGRSGQPIVFRGETDARGRRLAIVDGSKPLEGDNTGSVWQKDDRYDGGDVYYYPQNSEPWTLVLVRNDSTYDIPKIVDDYPGGGKKNLHPRHPASQYNSQTILNFPPGHMSKTIYMRRGEGENRDYADVAYWAGIAAVYYYDKDQGRVYLRFGDNWDPNQGTIRYATEACFRIDNQQHVIMADLTIRAGVSGVEINGSAAKYNKVENCYLANGQQRILMVNGASYNEIANNLMRMQGVAEDVGGAWAGGEGKTKEEEYIINEHIYDVYKYELGEGTSSPNEDCGVDMMGKGSPRGIDYDPAGEFNKIYGNDIAESLGAVEAEGISNIEIYDNTIRETSSMAVKIRGEAINIRVHDNLFYNVNFLARFQELHESVRREVYFYRNRFWNEPGVGTGIYAHYDQGKGPRGNNEIYIYHNSFAGSGSSISASYKNTELSGWYVLNNVFSTNSGVSDKITSLGTGAYGYDYNWCGGNFEKQSWYGGSDGQDNNVYPATDRQEMWSDATRSDATRPDFQLPGDRGATGTALNLSVKKVNGRLLPGFEEGYYVDEPDMGAIEFGSDDTPTDPEPEPPTEPVRPIAATYASVPTERATSLEESYWAAVEAYQFGDPTGGSNNRVTVKVIWNEQYLVIGIAVTDDDLRTTHPTKIWKNDAIDLLFDPTNQRQLNWNPYTGPHRQLLVDIDRGQYSHPRDFGNAASPYLVKGEGSYYCEVRLPWSVLGEDINAIPGLQLGFDVANHDLDARDKTQFTYTQRVEEFPVPSRFATLELHGPTIVLGEELDPQTEAAARQLTVYPNPSPEGNPFLLLSGFGQAQVQIINNRGQVVYRGLHSESRIDTKQRFPGGLYVVRVSDRQGTLTKKLFIE